MDEEKAASLRCGDVIGTPYFANTQGRRRRFDITYP
jgi:hypothetical protein